MEIPVADRGIAVAVREPGEYPLAEGIYPLRLAREKGEPVTLSGERVATRLVDRRVCSREAPREGERFPGLRGKELVEEERAGDEFLDDADPSRGRDRALIRGSADAHAADRLRD